MIVKKTIWPATKETWAVFRSLVLRGEAEDIGKILKLTSVAVQQWCRAPRGERERANGRVNPLNRIEEIIRFRLNKDKVYDNVQELAQHISSLCGGVHIKLPPLDRVDTDHIIQSLSRCMKEHGEAIEQARKAWFEGDCPYRLSNKEKADALREIEESIAELAKLRYIINES